jgi:tRNA A-37 threonylcarbamoyl transferase component Bud32
MTTTNDPVIGRRLANFQVEYPLGRGGMAQVYYGQDVKLRRPVAIKVIDARYRDKPAYAERFVREAQTIATWRHENIIQIYYADDEDGLYYFVMEYIDGEDLAKILAQYRNKRQYMSQAELLRIGRAIAAALDYAHNKGIIHRDVKPSNVIVAQDGRVVLADFGLAMDAEMGSMGEVFGSAHYVAPEQARHSADAVPQSDLYSLGIILYEMLTGKVPFDDPSSTAVAIQHLTFPVPSPREINPALSPETEVVLLKALSKSPQDRYQTGRELLDALQGSLQFTDATLASPLPQKYMATAMSPAAPVAPTAGSRPLIFYIVVGLGAGLLVLALILISMFAFFFDEPADNGTDLTAVPVVTTEATQQPAAQPSPAVEVVAEATETTIPETQVAEPTEPPTEEAPTATPPLPSPTAVVEVVVEATETTVPETQVAEPTEPPTEEAPTATPLPPSPTATPTPTITPVPEPQVLADSGADFSSGQTGKWVYIWSQPASDSWNPLRYEQRRYGDCWYAEDYIRICPDSGHPGNGADIAWYWTSQVSGTLEVQLSARKLDRGGDGVTIAVYYNTLVTDDAEPIFQRSLAGNDRQGFVERIQLDNIAPEDSLLIVMRRNRDPTSDHTAFNARICHYRCPEAAD